MKAIERLYQYFEFKHIKPTRFEKKIGLSNGYLGTQLKRKGNLGEDIFIKIIDYCLDLNPVWFVSGEGQMISATRVTDPNDKMNAIQEEITQLKTIKSEKNPEQPLENERTITALLSLIDRLEDENNQLKASLIRCEEDKK